MLSSATPTFEFFLRYAILPFPPAPGPILHSFLRQVHFWAVAFAAARLCSHALATVVVAVHVPTAVSA